MRNGAAILASLGAALLIPGTVRADNAGVKRAIQASYDRIGTAFRNKDVSAMEALLTPDATLTTPNHQTWKRDRIIRDFKQQSAMMKDASWQRTITDLKVHGNSAVATVHGKFHGVFHGAGPKDQTFDLTSLTVDTWHKAGGQWKLYHADTRELHPLINGKPIGPGMAGRAHRDKV